MDKWKPTDYIAVILTFVISFLLVLAVVSPVFTGRPLSDLAIKMISGVVGSIVSIVSMYVGANIHKYKDK